MNINYFMNEALNQAKNAFDNQEVPVGGILVDIKTNEIIGKSHNRVNKEKNAIYHCEIDLIINACKKLSSKYLNNTVMFVTLEPCAMCAHAISLARINKLVFGAYDSKNGGVEHGARIFSNAACNHIPEIIGGVYETEASDILREFFKARR